jgi:hypothetical protein
MIRLFHDRAIWRTILAMLHASPGVARGSFGEYRLGTLHRQHPHRHPPGDRCRRRQNRHPVLPRRPAAVVCGHRDDRAVQAVAARISAEQAAWICWSTRPGAGMSSSMPELGGMECLAVAAAAGPVRCYVQRRAAYAFRRAGTVHAASDRRAGQPGGDRLGGDPGGQAARVRRGIRNGQGRRRPAGPGRGGAQLREHGVASTAMHPAAVPPRASCNTPTAWT